MTLLLVFTPDAVVDDFSMALPLAMFALFSGGIGWKHDLSVSREIAWTLDCPSVTYDAEQMPAFVCVFVPNWHSRGLLGVLDVAVP